MILNPGIHENEPYWFHLIVQLSETELIQSEKDSKKKTKNQLCPSVNQFGFMASAKNTDYRRTGMAAVVGDDCVFFPLTLCLWCERQIIKEKAR